MIGFSRITAFLLALFLFLYPIPYTPYSTFAVDSTPSADTKIKLEELKKEIASKAANLKVEVGEKLRNKAFVGFVKSTSEGSITLATKTGTKIVNTNEYTEYAGFGKKKGTIASLNMENFVAALGDVDETETLSAKKIIKLSSEPEEKQIIFGAVLSIGDNMATIQTKQSQKMGLIVNSETVFKSAQKQNLSFDDLKINQLIISAGTNPKNGIMKARFIYVTPYTASLKIQHSTSSAQPK